MDIDNRVLGAIILVALALIALAGWAYSRRRRTQQLRERFGTEYDRAVQQHGGIGPGETVLEQREKRVKRLSIVPLAPSAHQRYSQHWLEIQHRFVDDPKAAVTAADDLISDVMAVRGYPAGEFEQRSADISVDHPQVVEDYRAAHSIALRNRRVEANTEDLRQAMVLYRSLFQELLGTETGRKEVA
jgi:hypothetical protein